MSRRAEAVACAVDEVRPIAGAGDHPAAGVVYLVAVDGLARGKLFFNVRHGAVAPGDDRLEYLLRLGRDFAAAERRPGEVGHAVVGAVALARPEVDEHDVAGANGDGPLGAGQVVRIGGVGVDGNNREQRLQPVAAEYSAMCCCTSCSIIGCRRAAARRSGRRPNPWRQGRQPRRGGGWRAAQASARRGPVAQRRRCSESRRPCSV